VHSKTRNRLLHDRMRDLVFVKFNSRLRQKKENKSKDPIEKELNDVLEDDANEFITGIVPDANAEQEEGHDGTQDGGSHGPSMPQAQAKRKRPVRPRRKKIRSLQSLMHDDLHAAISASSSESEDEMQIQSLDSAGSEDE
ncbi:hypothetical protein BS78_05G072800, partial [Paspalum vaginatum]